MKYAQVHYVLKQKFGPAKNHTCGCGAPAVQWAWQHTGTPTFDDNIGYWYSEDLGDYKPMCLSCHNKLDKNLEHLSKMGKLGMAAAAPKMAEHRKRLARINHTAQRRCTCGRTFARTGLGRHQQVSGHQGYEDIT